MTPNTSAEGELRCTKFPFFTEGEHEGSSDPVKKKKKFCPRRRTSSTCPPARTEGGSGRSAPRPPRCPARPGSGSPHGEGARAALPGDGARGTSTEARGSLTAPASLLAAPPGPARPPAWKGPSRPCAWGQRGARRALSGDTAREVHPPRRAGHAGLLPGRAAPPPVQRMCCQRGRELGETAAPPLPARGPRRTITSTLCPGGHRPPSTRGFLFGTQAWETHRAAERNE